MTVGTAAPAKKHAEWGRTRPEREAGFNLAKDIEGAQRNGLYRSLGGTGGMPLTAFYDANGLVVQVVAQQLTAAEIQQNVAQLLP